jgi:hypothetical protein
MKINSEYTEMNEMIRQNRMAIYSKPRRYFNRDGNVGSAIKFLFLIEVIAFLMLVFTAGSVNAQEITDNNILQTEYTFNSTISNFTSVYNTGKVFINWSAKNEQSDCIYIIERSGIGDVFESVGVKEGIGTSVELFYSWIDSDPPEGFSYYRIKKITKDGTQFYSATKAVINQGSSFDPANNYASGDQKELMKK